MTGSTTMTTATSDALFDDSGDLQFVKDFVGVDFHNDGVSHLDALCHVSFRGNLFGGAPASSAKADPIAVF